MSDHRIPKLIKRIEIIESDNRILKKALALLIAETGLTNKELNELKPKAKEIYKLLNDKILDI